MNSSNRFRVAKTLRYIRLLIFGSLALSSQTALAADALKFFNNWFVTGDYASAGVGLANTSGAGAIKMTDVPCTSGAGAGAVLAPCTVAGSIPAYPVAAFLYWQTVESSPTSASKGIFNGSPITGKVLESDSVSACWVTAPSQTLRSYRADVLRFLPIDPTSHYRRANGSHTLSLGAAVNGNTGVLSTLGASLVVIYRVTVAGNPLLMPLRSVVIYDGEFTLTKHGPDMTQSIAGFYQAAADPAAKITYIVGNGQSGFRETLMIHDDGPGSESGNQPFTGAKGASWDNLSFPFELDENASSVSTRSHVAGGQSNCLSWGAIVVSTKVKDSDNDGLLDLWETSGIHRNVQASPATFGTCANFPQEACVNLKAMGAVNGVKDIFLQLDWMHGYGDGTGGSDGTGKHSHVPKLDALTAVAKSFAAHNVAIHFDVGANYQGLNLPYIIPASAAQGGSDLDENSLLCADSNTHICSYHERYPVLSFKLGFNSVRDGNRLLGIPAHFAQNRKDAFRYVLLAHALSGPFDLNGSPISDPPGMQPVHPRSYSGIGDRPGGDIMITLGLWRSDIPANDQVGSVLVQAGTLMHELGHNLNLSHGGLSSTPNCSPVYPSVMSYLYQTRGLTNAAGIAQIDFSDGQLSSLNENSVSSSTSLGPLRYKVRYYGPLGPGNSPGQAAQRHCDGTPTGGALEVRGETATLATPDWSNGTVPLGTVFPLDVNFDGIAGQKFTDQPDWASLDLRQIGSRTNFGSISVGSVATDAGSIATDAGSIATDAGSIATDAGSIATDAGSIATDAGSVATDAGSVATDAGDEDYATHILSTTDSIPTPQQCAGCGLIATNELNDIKLNWTPPDTGGALTYNIYRCAGTGCSPLQAAALLRAGFAPTSKSAPFYLDVVNDSVHAGATCPNTATCYNTPYTYVVTAVSIAGTESPYSNTASSQVNHLFVVADTQAVVYGSPTPAPTYQIYGEISGSLTSGVTCSYSVTPRNAGTYPVICAGPATTSPTDGVTYNAPYLTYPIGSLTISRRPITVTAAASSKTYDGTTASNSTPAITVGSLAFNDSVTWTETFDNRNVGTTHILTPAGTVSDTNGGGNYNVTFTNIGGGVINKAPLTITAQTNTKTYDATVTAAAVPLVSGTQTGDSVNGLAETYDSASAGSGKTLAVSTYTVNDGNSGGNYAVTLVANTTGLINNQIDLMALIRKGDSAIIAGPVLRLTGASGQTSAAWLANKAQLASGFSTSFTFQITQSNGQLADGFAFVIQNAATGTATLGTTGLGGLLGYAGIPNSLAVEFDTYQNSENGDPASPHIAIHSNGIAANSADHNSGTIHTAPVLANFADGATHTATIRYVGRTLTVLLDGLAVTSEQVDLSSLLMLDSGSAFVGFTGATGAAQENADIRSWLWN